MKPTFVVFTLLSVANIVTSFIRPNIIGPFSNRNNLIMKNKLNEKNNLKNIDDNINNFVDKIKDFLDNAE